MKYLILALIFAIGYCLGIVSDHIAVNTHKMGTVLIDDRFDEGVKFRFVFDRDLEEIPESNYILFNIKISHNLGDNVNEIRQY